MEKELIQLGLNVLNLIIERSARNPQRHAVFAEKLARGESIEMADLHLLSTEREDLIAEAEELIDGAPD